MENLNAEQVKKALEFCANWDITTECKGCPYEDKCRDNDITKDALALINSQEQRIKELTEELTRKETEYNELYELCESYRKELGEVKADTVRKMQERLKDEMRNTAKYSFGRREYSVIGEEFIDQIAKEMLEDAE